MSDLFHTFSGNIFLVFGHQKIINSWKHFQNFLQKEKKTFHEQIMWDKTKTKKRHLRECKCPFKVQYHIKNKFAKKSNIYQNFPCESNWTLY